MFGFSTLCNTWRSLWYCCTLAVAFGDEHFCGYWDTEAVAVFLRSPTARFSLRRKSRLAHTSKKLLLHPFIATSSQDLYTSSLRRF